MNTRKGGPYYQTNTDLDGADTKISPRKATRPVRPRCRTTLRTPRMIN